MLEAYERDKFAASNQSTRAANLAVWVRLVKLWFGPGTEVIPVEPEHIQAVGAIMKRHGYRSFSQYITRARDLHIKCGFAWSPKLVQEASQGVRSVTRGQGPPRQSAPLDVDAVRGMNVEIDPVVPDGVLNAGDAFVLGAAFLL